MSRLPYPGQDANAWGSILNDYLSVEHNSDGSLKKAADITAAKAKADTAVQSVNAKTGTAVVLTASDVGALTQTVADARYILESNAVAQGSQVVSVQDSAYGAVGNGTTDDTAAIQAAIDAAPSGATIYFPPGTYAITAAIRLKGNLAYVGAGHALGSGSVIKQANGANITGPGSVAGLFVANSWYIDATTCDNPIRVSNLQFEGNAANNPSSTACGIVLCNFWSFINDCHITNAPLHGIHLTDVTRHGSNVITNSASENRISRTVIRETGGHGISQICQNNISNQDGYCIDNIIASTQQNGINFARGSGWIFRRNHLYAIQGNGISLANCYATILDGNEIETFGEAAAAGVYYGGISVTQLNDRGTIITNNYVGSTEPSSGVGAYQYISASAGSGQTDAHVIIANNLMHGPATPSSKGIAMVTEGGNSGSVLHARCNTNAIKNVNSTSYISSGVKIYEQDSQHREHAVVGATTSRYGGSARGTGAPPVGGSGNDFFGTFSFGTGTGATAGTVGGVTFEQGFSATTQVIVLSPGNAATAALNIYTAPFDGGFNIGCATAPADGQAGDTYIVKYHVQG